MSEVPEHAIHLTAEGVRTIGAAAESLREYLAASIEADKQRPAALRAPRELVDHWQRRIDLCREVERQAGDILVDVRLGAAFAREAIGLSGEATGTKERWQPPFALAYQDGSGYLPKVPSGDEPAKYETFAEAEEADDVLAEDGFPTHIVPYPQTWPGQPEPAADEELPTSIPQASPLKPKKRASQANAANGKRTKERK